MSSNCLYVGRRSDQYRRLSEHGSFTIRGLDIFPPLDYCCLCLHFSFVFYVTIYSYSFDFRVANIYAYVMVAWVLIYSIFTFSSFLSLMILLINSFWVYSYSYTYSIYNTIRKVKIIIDFFMGNSYETELYVQLADNVRMHSLYKICIKI